MITGAVLVATTALFFEKGVRRRLLTIGSGEGGIGGVPCEVADDRSDGELGVGQAESEVRGPSGQFLG